MRFVPIFVTIATGAAALFPSPSAADQLPVPGGLTPVALDTDPPPPNREEPGWLAGTTPVAKALARLREKLASGQRDEFPPGTAARDRCHFLALDLAMTWEQAEQFAEAHGAHLAVLPTEKDRQWFRRQFPTRSPLWIGAGRTAHDRWQWIDGSPWSDAGKLRGELTRHRHLALAASAALLSVSPSETCELALQWRDDGSNPATVEAQLARTASSVTTRNADGMVYPLGTRTYGDSHFFYHESSLSWDEARKSAKAVGARLAVPSSLKEHKWICFTFGAALARTEGLWLGGFRLKPGDRWRWLSGEQWNNAGWKLDDLREIPALNRLALQKALDSDLVGWVASDGSNGQAEGLLMEWSPARPKAAATEQDWKPWLDQIHRELAREIDPELRALQKRRKPLLDDYYRNMRRFARNGNDRLLRQDLEAALTTAEKSGRLLSALPEGASPQIRAQQEKTQTNLEVLEWDYRQSINGYLQVYGKELRSRSAELSGSGYLAAALRMTGILERIEDEEFLPRLFSGTSQSPPPWAPAGK